MFYINRSRRLAASLVAALAIGSLAVPTSNAAEAAAIGTPIAAQSVQTVNAEIVGEPVVGQTLRVQTPDAPAGAETTYTWLANGVEITGATGAELPLTAAQADAVIEAVVTWSVPGSEPLTATASTVLRVATASVPTTSGTTREGSTMIAYRGTWTTGTTFTYQWLADGQPIAGATGSRYVLTAAESGKAISVAVTGTLAGYPTVQRVSATAPLRVMSWTVPTIKGTVAYGSTLRAVPGEWTADTAFSYQWYASGTAISSATSSTLKLGTAQKDKTIAVKVTGRKSGHTTTTKTSAKTAKVITAPTPTISGTPVYGKTLTAKPGTWTTGTTLSYRWYADGVAVTGATASTLKLGSALKDKEIRVKVTGRKDGYATVTKTSRATLRVQTAPTPTVSGTPKVTYTLSASKGTWSSGTSFTYQWYASGIAISGATGSTLKLGTANVGKTIKVKVTGRKSGYPTVSRTSSATASVTYPLRTAPSSTGSCPSWAPIKGNADSMIYHMPWQRYYSVTKAEDCFRTEAAAQDAGYRRAKV